MNKIDKIADDIEKMKGDIGEVKIDLAKHMYRSDLNEENMILIREEFKIMKADFKPVKRSHDMMNLCAKLIVGLGGILLFLQQMGWLDTILKILRP